MLPQDCHLCQHSLCRLRGCTGEGDLPSPVSLGLEQCAYLELMDRYGKEEATLVYELGMLLSASYKTPLRVALAKAACFPCATRNLEVDPGALVQYSRMSEPASHLSLGLPLMFVALWSIYDCHSSSHQICISVRQKEESCICPFNKGNDINEDINDI